MLRKIYVLVFAVFVFFIFNYAAKAAQNESMYDRLSRMPVVKVYVLPPGDVTSDKKADKNSLRELLQNALSARRTINFEVIQKKEDADIVIACEIVEYFWTDKSSGDLVQRVRSMVVNGLRKESYARMQAVFSVHDNKLKKEIWKGRLKTSVSEKKMSPTESLLMINEKIVKVFMRECFSKNTEETQTSKK